MHNYWHEIICPENRGMGKYLWNDYFHDSYITKIAYVKKSWMKYDLVLTLQCEREWEYNIDDSIYDEKYTYYLKFIDVKYHSIEGNNEPPEYVNGRFKDTAMLRRYMRACGKQLYHFRIQLVNGYIDIIFRGFQLHKAVGRMKYKMEDCDTPTIRERYTLENIHNRIDTRDYCGDEEFEILVDMENMYKQNDDEIEVYLRKCMEILDSLEVDFAYAIPYVAYLLGKFGNVDDLSYILKVYLSTNSRLIKRNALDAIEAIAERM